MAAERGDDAYVTLLLSDNYLPGALVLAHSLRDAGTTKKLVVLVTLDSVSAEVIKQLQAVFDHVIPVPRVRNEKPANLYLMNRADLHSAFTKINLWKQTQFRKIVYLDADVVAYRAVDELFDLPHAFSAAPDVGWPDIFNTGVMVLTPNMGDYYALKAMAERGISFDGADQGLLNMHFKNSYNRLSFAYNVTPSAHYSYVPAYRHFQSTINLVHFIGSEKPWAQGRTESSGDNPYGEMLGRWWAVYDRHYRQYESYKETNEEHKVPEIIQYFVKGEFQPPTVTYIVPTGEPPLHQGRFTHDSHSGHDDQHGHSHSENHVQQYDSSHSAPFYLSTDAEDTRTEAGKEQFTDPPTGGSATHHEEHKPEPPPMEYSWDAQRHPPPADSKPEALNFPQTHYEMSSDPAPFVPPQRYPSPPRNMWYEVPKEKPAPRTEKPRPIFPWESQQPKPTRVFADDIAQSETSMTEDSTTTEPSESSSVEHKSETSAPTTPSFQVTTSDPWSTFTRVNAWDDDPDIEKYVDAMPLYRRHKSQGSLPGQKSPGSVGGSAARTQQDTSAGAEWRKRGVKLTDFPTAVERPSLPVTPAPIRRAKFWDGTGPGTADDGADDDQLPAADGVPRQADWDPVARLQLLAKQQSELLMQKLGAGEAAGGSEAGDTIGIEGHDIPKRPLPFGSEPTPSSRYVAHSATVHSPQPVKPSGVGPLGILVGQSQRGSEFTPRSASGATKPADPNAFAATIPSPSYHGPGAAWEKDEGYLGQSTALPPSEEEKDVLET